MMWRFEQFADNTALVSEDGSEVSYAALQSESDKLAAAVGSRCLVFMFCRNEKGSLLGYVSFLNNRIVPLMLNAEIDREMLNVLLTSYKPDFLWVPFDMAGKLPEYTSVYSVWGYTLLKTPNNGETELYDELALLLTTSGSTGSPKFVRQSYGNIRANTESIVQYLELGATERSITTMPMSYTYGLSIINSHLWVGASIILSSKTMMQKEFWKQFKYNGATSFGGVPYIYEMLDKLRFYRMDLPKLRTITQAGGKLSLELHKKFAGYAEQTNRRFVVMYGQTEATARMSYLPWEYAVSKAGSIGIVIPGGEFTLTDDNGSIITEGNITGELVYTGKNVTLGYAESVEELNKGDENRGVLHTGDIAKRDSEGFYYIVGRKKRFLKLFGNRVNLDDVERMLQQAGFECACGGIDDRLVIYLTDQEKTSEAKALISAKMGLNPSAFTTIPIKEIPRNESGKVLYSKLEELYG